jgi:hypothetical protein
MSRHGRTKLVIPKMEPETQVLEVIEESTPQEQKEEPVLPELDMEIECPRCNDIMELQSNFDELVYTCESCSFLLKCV